MNQEFYVANEMLSEVILGLDWLVNNKFIIDTANMVMKFPDATCQPLLMFDASLKDPTVVVLSDDIEIPGRHEIVQAARIRNPIISESILEPNFDLAEKGVFVASVLVKPKEQTLPIQIINPGVDTVKLYKGTNIGCLQQIDVEMNDPVLDPGGNTDSSSQQCELNFDLENLKPDERKLMDNVLREYQDIFATNLSEIEHLSNLTDLLTAIRNAGLKLKPSKCHFAQTSVKFLGFQIGDTGLTPDPEKVKAIKEYPVPKDLTELRRFIGMISYYRRFILRFSDVASPLHHAVSRAPVNNIQISRYSVDELQELQDLDEDLSRVKGWIREDSRPEQKPRNGTDVLYALYNIFDSLSVENDLLSRSWEDDTGKERYQVVLPKFIAPTILKEAHEQVGHMGVAKTFDFIQRRFYWPGFFKSVENFCACCEICAKNKTVPRPRWPLKPIDVVPIPFYMIGVNLIGPLKTTRSGNKYILSVIDYYTKYAEAEALPNQEAETIVRALEEIFARHGMPSVLLTDQGRNFESHLMKSACQLFGIEKRRTTAYHPQTDGLCERFNGVLKALLRMKVNSDKNDWDEQLPHALLAYQVSKQSSTGVTPFEMLYGRDVRLPLGTEQEELLAKPTHGPAKYLEDLRKRQDDI
eukprot:gene13568-14969_t